VPGTSQGKENSSKIYIYMKQTKRQRATKKERLMERGRDRKLGRDRLHLSSKLREGNREQGLIKRWPKTNIK
jgi:hypothetical protein